MPYKNAFLKIFGVFLLLFIVLTVPNNQTFANDISNIKISANNAIGPRCMTRTPDKTIHVVYWNKEGNGSKLYYINSIDEGINWTPPFLLSQNYNDSKHACLAVDESGKLYVFWDDFGKILYTFTLDNGNKWSPIYKISGRYEHAESPSVIVSKAGDLHIVFENEGEIYYRSYIAKERAWSTLYNISHTATLSKTPQISISSGEFVIATWVEDGEIAVREMVLPSNTWDDTEIISREAENLYRLKEKANLNPQLIVDANKKVHAIWGNGTKIIHRLRVNEFWSPAPSILAREAMQWFGAPTCTLDMENSVHCAWVEKGKIVFRSFDENKTAWNMPESLPSLLEEGFHSAPILGPAWTKDSFEPKTGFDMVFIKRSTLESKDYHCRFFSNATFAPDLAAPQINSVIQTGGRLSVSWQPSKEQTAFRLIVGSTSPVTTPYLYDSSIVKDPVPQHLTKAFAFKGTLLYVQVKTSDRNGVWSTWSKPYRYKISQSMSVTGPEMTLKGIEENSLYLYSPSPNIIYFGNGLDSPKTFTILGSAIGKNSGIKEISFSKFGSNTPPPIVDPESTDWEVQYSVRSADTAGEIIITATDYNGNSNSTKVYVIKDATPPDPPSWVRINPDKEGRHTIQNKKYNDNKVYVFWKNGSDQESGIRYHVMGTSNQWWKDSVHRSGDMDIAQEGYNTFYVFAIDNVGNVSVPGTDTIFVDTISPFPPRLISNMTSSNIIHGIKSPDTVKILVDGMANQVEIISSTNWKFTSDLEDKQKKTFSLQAIDLLQNKSDIVTANVSRKSTPPEISSVWHEPAGPFRGKDTITFKLKGEVQQLASLDIPKVVYDLVMYDDGNKGDEKKNDGIYTASYEIPADTPALDVNAIGTLEDAAGNRASIKDKKIIRIDSRQSVLLDDFEILGTVYPWSNHIQAKNVDAASEKDIEAPGGGTSVCKVQYDFADQQNWAAFSSREFLPRNCFGIAPRLQFQLKGSGSTACKAAIKIRTKKSADWNKEIKEFPSSEYTFPLSNRGWQTIEMPLPQEVIDNIDQVTQYSLILYSPNSKEKGTFYLDNLRIVYKGTPRGAFRTKVIPQKMLLPEDRKEITFTPKMEEEGKVSYPIAPKGDFVPAPYLAPIFYPNPVRAGSPVRLKVSIPTKYKATEVAVLLWQNGNKLVSSKLKQTNAPWWHGVTAMPAYVKEGSYFGTLYIKTGSGHFLKTKFPFQVIRSDSQAAIDQVVATFYPHPFIPGVGATIKVKVPRHLQAKKVALFFGESNGKAMISDLYIKNITDREEYWFGSVTLPDNLEPGNYNTLLIVKTRRGQAFKKKLNYSVISK